MKLILNRKKKTPDAILGDLLVSDVFNCFTLERIAVAIPAGCYSVELTYSPHFGRVMPLLDGVEGRSDIRIHPLNLPSQSEGCIGVGQSLGADCLNNSLAAFNPLEIMIAHCLALGESVTIEIRDLVVPHI